MSVRTYIAERIKTVVDTTGPEKFAIKVSRNGTTWYLDALGEPADFWHRRRFLTAEDAEEFCFKPWPILSKSAARTVKRHYLSNKFTVQVVDVTIIIPKEDE